jgi:hypothetical protein
MCKAPKCSRRECISQAVTLAALKRHRDALKKQITAYQRFIVKYEGEWNGAQAPEKKEA